MAILNRDDLTMDNLRLWLNGKEDETLVGIRGSFTSCPLARFGKETWGIPSTQPALVGYGEFRLYPEDAHAPLYMYDIQESCELPAWTIPFISRVDGDGGGDAWGKPIKAGRVKKILQEVRDEWAARHPGES